MYSLETRILEFRIQNLKSRILESVLLKNLTNQSCWISKPIILLLTRSSVECFGTRHSNSSIFKTSIWTKFFEWNVAERNFSPQRNASACRTCDNVSSKNRNNANSNAISPKVTTTLECRAVASCSQFLSPPSSCLSCFARANSFDSCLPDRTAIGNARNCNTDRRWTRAASRNNARNYLTGQQAAEIPEIHTNAVIHMQIVVWRISLEFEIHM